MPHAAPKYEVFQQQIATGQPQPYTQDAWYKATLPRRLSAVLIDCVLVLLPAVVLGYWYTSLVLHLSAFSISYMILWPLVLFLLYNTVFVWQLGYTVGKRAVGIRVVQTNFTTLSLPQAFLREVVGKCFSEPFLLAGCWSAAWDKDRQTLHDKIAGTLVVTKLPDNGHNSRWVYAGLVVQMLALLAAAVGIITLHSVHRLGM